MPPRCRWSTARRARSNLVDAIAARGGLDGYELLPAVRADLLRRLGRKDERARRMPPRRRRRSWSRCGHARRMREME